MSTTLFNLIKLHARFVWRIFVQQTVIVRSWNCFVNTYTTKSVGNIGLNCRREILSAPSVTDHSHNLREIKRYNYHSRGVPKKPLKTFKMT